jgi:hypothetical protein
VFVVSARARVRCPREPLRMGAVLRPPSPLLPLLLYCYYWYTSCSPPVPPRMPPASLEWVSYAMPDKQYLKERKGVSCVFSVVGKREQPPLLYTQRIVCVCVCV